MVRWCLHVGFLLLGGTAFAKNTAVFKSNDISNWDEENTIIREITEKSGFRQLNFGTSGPEILVSKYIL